MDFARVKDFRNWHQISSSTINFANITAEINNPQAQIVQNIRIIKNCCGLLGKAAAGEALPSANVRVGAADGRPDPAGVSA